jgi:RNA-binding protein
MEAVGEVSHQARSGRLIVRVRRPLKPGTILIDDKGRRVGRVVELIGPVRAPYASCEPLTERVRRIIGRKVFVREVKGRFGDRPRRG